MRDLFSDLPAAAPPIEARAALADPVLLDVQDQPPAAALLEVLLHAGCAGDVPGNSGGREWGDERPRPAPAEVVGVTASGWCCHTLCPAPIGVPTADVGGAEVCEACAGDRWPTTNGEG